MDLILELFIGATFILAAVIVSLAKLFYFGPEPMIEVAGDGLESFPSGKHLDRWRNVWCLFVLAGVLTILHSLWRLFFG